ncbi:sodium-dependent bicarbonate transport family permease [Mycobacterium parmense]|uniref:Sodium-dependent bicarbonate transport family permease n=1 Tax=Mycobacterium parmense TaxID=185642 RepID=A0A7I7YQN9_9MYCO|nr:sodium-dependent bicarbonate transport family permease [Mycobacterium parmense]MCV7353242.1 sodium-dependent bicarbonate transport family permease [Mycobacterium parmense]ORW63146.1 sodium-dependent bicarbonate transport family permease [Mycobacterium parmense]BBZ43253.1 sodium-dependent bicarbonate transport family permease [Mycobacterium parmense]
MIHEFLQNFSHNLFKPLLLFFYFGFLIPILRVRFEFPYVIYQGLSMYLLVAIGWQGGEELAKVKPADIDNIAEFVALGLVLNFVFGGLTYVVLKYLTPLRRIDRATIAGYYGSDSAGTFATCVAFLTGVKIAFDAWMPVELAFMEIPGCLVALYLVARLRHRGMDEAGFMADEPGYTAAAKIGPGAAARRAGTESLDDENARGVEEERELSLEKLDRPDWEPGPGLRRAGGRRIPIFSREILQEVFLNPGLVLLVGGIAVGFIGAVQGQKVVHDQNELFVSAFQGVLCLFLLEMGMTASRKLRDVRPAGAGFILFGLLAPIVFGALGILAAYPFAYLTDTHFQPGTYVLFAVLCGSASYITLPAVQRLGIPEASPTLPLAASLGLTFSLIVTVGIPIYIEINHVVSHWFPGV